MGDRDHGVIDDWSIFAVATARGPAGVSIIRVSGPNAGQIAARLTGQPLPKARTAAYRRFSDPWISDESGRIDTGLLVWFPGPESFTGEDVAEFHTHGGVAVSRAMLDVLARESGARAAEPGEFSRRAFENGKLDLTEAEGIADLVAAETAAQHRQALRQMEGGVGRLYDGWRTRLISAQAYLEAGIDFADEDLPPGAVDAGRDMLAGIQVEIQAHLDDGRRGEILRQGLRIAIFGAVNVGKSSLLNALARRDAAIVSTQAGTTRDAIEVHLDLGGYPVTVVDTAGLRAAADRVEQEGVRRARQNVAHADIAIALFDATCWPHRDAETEALIDADTVMLLNKCDLVDISVCDAARDAGMTVLSVATGEGLGALLERLTETVGARLDAGVAIEAPALTRERHRRELQVCVGGLGRALAHPEPEYASELVAEDVRLAARALGRITGRVDVEDILDVVFADFCIGK